MIIEEIKNSIRKTIFNKDKDIIFHFEQVSHTGFPYAILRVKNFKIEPYNYQNKQKCSFSFEIVYQKSEDNSVTDLFNGQTLLNEALLPAISINNKNITLDNPVFTMEDKQLIMSFDITLYTLEDDTNEQMKTIDITIKGE